MNGTYDPNISTDKDWVRFETLDRGPTFLLSDEEIEAALASHPNKWLAAADCGDVVISRNRGVLTKKVGDTSLSYGIVGATKNTASPYQEHIGRLRDYGNLLLMGSDGKSGVLRAL